MLTISHICLKHIISVFTILSVGYLTSFSQLELHKYFFSEWNRLCSNTKSLSCYVYQIKSSFSVMSAWHKVLYMTIWQLFDFYEQFLIYESHNHKEHLRFYSCPRLQTIINKLKGVTVPFNFADATYLWARKLQCCLFSCLIVPQSVGELKQAACQTMADRTNKRGLLCVWLPSCFTVISHLPLLLALSLLLFCCLSFLTSQIIWLSAAWSTLQQDEYHVMHLDYPSFGPSGSPMPHTPSNSSASDSGVSKHV